MKIFPILFCLLKRAFCLSFLLLAVLGLHAQTERAAELNTRRAEIQSLLNDGIYLEAIRKLEEYLQQDPEDIAARREIAKAYLELEDYFRLRYHAKIIVQEFPEDSQALAWTATADEIIAEKYAVMVADLLDALKEDPENTVLRRELISLYMTGDEGEKAAEQFRILLALQPDDEALWLDFARNLYWADQPEESLVAYQQYLQVARQPKDVRLEIARVHAANAQFGTAVELLHALIDDVPDNYEARALLGDIFRWNDDAMAAEEIYRAVLKEDPEQGAALRGLEELAKMAQRRVITTASMNVEAMREKVEADPGNMDLLLQLARLYTTNNRYAEAALAFDQYLKNRPDDLPVRREYAFTLSIEERYDEAIQQLRLYLQEFPDDMTERMRIARMLIWQEKNEAAKRELLEMEAFIPDNPELHWNLARIYEIEADWPQAIARYEMLRENAPRFEVATAKIRQIKSNPYYQIAILEEQIKDDPDNTSARLQLARTFLDLERFYEAQEQAQAVLDQNSEDEQAQRIVGWAELGLAKARRDRMEELLVILAEDPENYDATLEMARIYREEEDYPEALRYYFTYLNAFPQDRQARLEYARVLSWEPEQRDSAIREYAILIEDQPDDIDLRLTHLELLSAASALTANDMSVMADVEDALRERLASNREDAEALLFMGRLYQINSKWPEALAAYRAAIEVSDRDELRQSSIRDRIDTILALPDFQLAQLFTQVEENPSDVTARLILARQLFDLKRYYEAREQATLLLDYDPENVEASRIVGWSDIGIQEVLYERIRTARSQIRENPQDMEAALELARALKEANIYPESLRYYYYYLQAFPNDIEVREEYAQVLSWEPTQLASAVQEWAILAELRPDDMSLQLQYYELLSRVGELSKRDLAVLSAIEDRLRERVHFNDQDSEALFYLGRLHQLDGNLTSAVEYYQAAVVAGIEDNSVQTRIDSILDLPDFQLTLLFAQVEKKPADVVTRLSLANQLFDLKRYYEAKEQATMLLNYDPDNVEASRLVGWSEIGIQEILYERIRSGRSRIRANPEDMETALDLARALKEATVYPESLRYYFHYLQAYPDDIKVREEYAQVLSWEPTQLASAVRERAVLAELRPDDLTLQLQYYELLSRVGELSQRDLAVLSAIEDRLRERVYFNDQDSEALFYLGRLHQLDGNMNSALDYYEAAILAGIEDNTVQTRIDSIVAQPDFQLARLTAQVEGNPSDVFMRLSLANQLYDLERYYEAREQANQVLAYDPGNVEASRIAAWSDIGIEEALYQRIRSARSQIRANPEDMDTALDLARALKDAEIYPESLRYYYHYLQAYPDDIEVREEYAQVLSWEPSQLPSAARELGMLAQMRPADLTLQLQYYELVDQLGELSRRDLTVLSAIEDRLRERIFFNDQDSEALFYLGRLHQIEENWNSALDYYEAALAAGSQDNTIQNRIASITGTPDFQIASLESRVANNPNDIDLRLSLVRLLLEYERYYQAQQQAELLLQLSGRNQEAREMYAYATQWIEGKQIEDLQNLRFQVTQNPRDLDAQLELARMLRNEGAYGEARQRYRLYLQAYPEDLEVRREYADTLAWSGEDTDEAISEYRDLLFAYPNDLELKMQYARMLSWSPKYWNEADKVLKEMSMLDRNNPEIIIMQADILRFRGRYGAAQRLYDQVLQMGSGVDGYYYDDREQRFIDERLSSNERRYLSQASVPAARVAVPDRDVFDNRGFVADEFGPNAVIYRDSGLGINPMPERSIYRPSFDENSVRRYRDSLLDTTPNSPRNMIRYPQGSLAPQSGPQQLPTGGSPTAATVQTASQAEASLPLQTLPEVPAPTAVPSQQSPFQLARYNGEKVEWRRPEPEDYEIMLAEMVLDPTDNNPLGSRNYAQRPTGSRMVDERYAANRRGEAIRPIDPLTEPLDSINTLETQPRTTFEPSPRLERYDPNQRMRTNGFFKEGAPVVNTRRPEASEPLTIARPRVERAEVFAPREVRRVEDPDFSPRSTYTIPGDPRVRVEPPAPVFTRPEPEPVERIIYREPVVRVPPEIIIQREVEYVPVPDRYIELPRRNLDDRRIFDQSPVLNRAPLRRAEPRVFVPQYEALPEPPRFYRELDRGVDAWTGTGLPAPTMYERRVFEDSLRAPTRYDYSRTPIEPGPVRYIRQRVATPDVLDPDYEYRSTLPLPTRFESGYDTSRRATRSGSTLRETDVLRYNDFPTVTTERRSRVLETDPRRYDSTLDLGVGRSSRLIETAPRRYEGIPDVNTERRSRLLYDERLREDEIRVPQRNRDYQNTLPPTRNDGLPYYYNSTGEDYLLPQYGSDQSIEFKRAQYQPQSNPFIQPNERDRRKSQDFARPDYRQNLGQPGRATRALQPQGYARPQVEEYARPVDRNFARTKSRDYREYARSDNTYYARPDEREFGRSRSYTLPAQTQPVRSRSDFREQPRPEAPARAYSIPAERPPLQDRTYAAEPMRREVAAPTYLAPQERQLVQPQTYFPDEGSIPASTPAPVYVRPEAGQPLQAQSSVPEFDHRQSAQAPTQPLRFEGRSSTINRLPYEERGRTYVVPQEAPIPVPPEVAPLPRQTDGLNQEILSLPRAVPATESTTFGRTYLPESPRLEPLPRQTNTYIRELPSQPQVLPVAPATTFGRPLAPRVPAPVQTTRVRAPLPLQTAERIQSFPAAADSGFNSDAYARALQGKSAIFDQLRPELMVDFGYENDTDGFTGNHIGGRYNHFTRNGNLYYLGLSFDNYTEDGLTPIDSVDAKSLLFGVSGYMNEDLRGFADLILSDYSAGPDNSLSITAGGSYNFDGVNTLTASYSRFDFFREAKTVRSLLNEITADRFRLDWTSNPIEAAEGRPFGERVYFEGSLAFTNLSDNNSSLAYSLRPYYRIADDPNIDVSIGWQGLSYSDQSAFYYSPNNVSGPTLGARISGQTVWDLLYDIRGFVSFPTQENSSRSLLISLRKEFTNNFSAGTNIFLTEAPRDADADYRFGSIFFDLSYQF